MEIKEVVTSLEYIKQCIGDEGIAGRTAGEAIDKAVKVLKTWRPPDDTIRRKDAIEAMGKATWAINRINKLPSAQPEVLACGEGELIAQPEIVRCRDCKYWMPHSQLGYDEDNETYHDYCEKLIPEDEYYAFYRDADDYCSRAERRTDERSDKQTGGD